MTTRTTMTTKTSLVLAAFAAAVAAQPASATTMAADPPDTAAASSLSLISPSPAALEQLRNRVEAPKTVVARRRGGGPFVRIIFVQAIKKRA